MAFFFLPRLMGMATLKMLPALSTIHWFGALVVGLVLCVIVSAAMNYRSDGVLSARVVLRNEGLFYIVFGCMVHSLSIHPPFMSDTGS